MEFLLKPLSSTVFFFFLVCSTTTFPSSRGEEDDDKFRECSRRYECGELRNLSYPFWGGDQPQHCGHPDFHVTCQSGNHSVFRAENAEYSILSLKHSDRSNTLRVARFDMLDGPCSRQVQNVNTTTSRYLQYGLDVHFPSTVKNLTLFYGCKTPEAAYFPYKFSCHEKSETVFYANDSLLESLEPNLRPGSCSEVIWVPIFPDALDKSLSSGDDGMEEVGRALSEGFVIIYPESEVCKECEDSGGICGYESSTPDQYFRCFCRDGVKTGLCNPGPGRDWKLKIIIGVCAAFAGIAVMSVICFFYQCRNRKKYAPSSLLFRNISSEISSGKGKDVEKGSTFLGVHLFSYEELVEATKNFDSSKELGDGGFGTVYYGELRDGRAVAVKRLYESNCRRVEQFMNEVEILAHLRHRNLVSLYGCTSRRSHELLLVYEYIPNGTVADHLHGEKAKPGELPWPIRLNIAIETAYALTYLHASEIIHRDVKTNNILLDKNFSVKVADFGLSRLFPRHVTHVSTAPQGTPGYVDPEYHQCYQLTSKSDVFSFGVVLMELVSSMPAVDITRHRHDINLSTMAMNRIQNHALHELVDPSLGFDSDSRVRKMITAVAELAFQCLQHEKDMRPSMADVLEELKAIQSRDNETEKAEKKDSAADDAVLLKNGPLTLSPDTVTINWSSRNTTPNASG